MAREKKGKGRASSPEIESPSSDSKETHDASPPPRVQPKRKAVATKVPKHAQGHNRPDPHAQSGQGSRARMKRASAPSSQDDDEEEISLDFLEHMVLRISRPHRTTPSDYNGHRMKNYTKGKHNFYNLRYENPRRYAKEMTGDQRFWLWFQADWYESVIMTKTKPVTEMKSIDW